MTKIKLDLKCCKNKYSLRKNCNMVKKTPRHVKDTYYVAWKDSLILGKILRCYDPVNIIYYNSNCTMHMTLCLSQMELPELETEESELLRTFISHLNDQRPFPAPLTVLR